jgi:hypothetical protein
LGDAVVSIIYQVEKAEIYSMDYTDIRRYAMQRKWVDVGAYMPHIGFWIQLDRPANAEERPLDRMLCDDGLCSSHLTVSKRYCHPSRI